MVNSKHGLKGFYHVECLDKLGNLKWVEDCENAVYDEGELLFLDIVLRNAAAPASWYLGLLYNTLVGAPAEEITLALIPVSTREPSNATDPGYAARATIARSNVGWPTLELDPGPATGDYKATSLQVTFTATGDWAFPIRWLFLTTQSVPREETGKVVSIAQLGADRTLLNGDSLNITYSMKLQ